MAICRGHRGLVRGRILGENIEGIFTGREGKVFFGPLYLPCSGRWDTKFFLKRASEEDVFWQNFGPLD